MHISHVHKTATNNYLENKHTAAEVIITYTVAQADIDAGSFTVEVADLKNVEGVFIQAKANGGTFPNEFDSNARVDFEGNEVTVHKVDGTFDFYVGTQVFINAFGTR